MKRLLLALVLLLAGCASSGQPLPPHRTAPVYFIEVQNNNWQNATVYAVEGGMDFRVGDVTTANRRVFRRRYDVTHSRVDFSVDLLGSPRRYPLEQSIMVSPGDTVEVVIQNHLATSFVSKRDL